VALVRDAGARRRAGLLLAVLTLATSGAVTLFFIFGRYRLAAVPFLVPLAAAGLLELVDITRRGAAAGRRLGRPAVDLAVLAAAGLAVNLPCWSVTEIRQQDAVIEYNLGTAAMRWAEASYAPGQPGGGSGQAVALSTQAVGYFAEAARDSPGFFAADLAGATALARHGSYLASSGHAGAALADFRTARARLVAGLAVVGRQASPEIDQAARSLLAALDRSGALTLTNIGLGLIEAGQLERAEEALVRARALAPDQPGPEGGLALCWLERARAARRAGAAHEASDLLRSSCMAYRRAARLAAAGDRGDLEALYRRGLGTCEAEITASASR
jgi:tetratricopeptide (TPR) repeat protein